MTVSEGSFNARTSHRGCTAHPLAHNIKGDSPICSHALIINKKLWLYQLKHFFLWIKLSIWSTCTERSELLVCYSVTFQYCMLFSHIPVLLHAIQSHSSTAVLHAIQSHSSTACYSITFQYCMLFNHIPVLHAIQSHSSTACYSVTFQYCMLFNHIPVLHAIQSHSSTACYSVTFQYCMLFNHIPALHAIQSHSSTAC